MDTGLGSVVTALHERIAALEALAGTIPAGKRWEVGDIKASIRTTADTDWLLFGQTVVNGQTLYPDLWAIIPASWKSGSNIVLPSLDGRDLKGDGTVSLGSLAGANARTLVAANLPPHAHANDHDHVSANTGFMSGDHGHNASGNTGADGFMQRGPYNGSNFDASFVDNGLKSVTFHANAQTGGVNANHTHALDLPNYTGNTGNGPGSSTAVDVTNAHLAVRFQIKAK